MASGLPREPWRHGNTVSRHKSGVRYGMKGLSRSQHEEACARAVHVHLCVIARVGTSQGRHPPWLHLRFEDKLGQTHGGVIAARQGQVHHALRAQQRVGRRKEII
jgi:hypothetical protein